MMLTSSSSMQYATYEKTREFDNFSIKITARFAYDVQGKTVSCISKYGKIYQSGSSVKEDSLTDTGSGRTCTAKFTVNFNKGIKQSVSIKCDYKGNANV